MKDPIVQVLGAGTMSPEDALFLLLLGQYSNSKTTRQWEDAVRTHWKSSPRYYNMLLTCVK